MTERQYKKVEKYIEKIKPLLGLTDWTIIVKRDPPPDPSALGWYRPVYGRHIALLYFDPEYADSYPEHEQRNTIVHELLHCVHSEPQFHVNETLKSVATGRAAEVFQTAWWQSHEYAIDSLATAMSALLPPIEL